MILFKLFIALAFAAAMYRAGTNGLAALSLFFIGCVLLGAL